MENKTLEKIVINVGIGRLSQQAQFKDKILPEVTKEVAMITGQKSATCVAKKAISNFKTREGDVVGLKTTLRGKRMEDFYYKLIHIVIPRVKDFRGIELSNVDANGNLNIGFREQYVFPEVSAEQSRVHFGIQVTVVLKTKDRTKAIDFYRKNKVPLKT